MVDVIKEKEKLTHELSDQYSRSIISLEEYEKMIDHVNKIESIKELMAVQKMTHDNTGLTPLEDNSQKHITVFSWRDVTLEPVNGNGGKYVCVFGANQIKVNDLPKGKTFLHVESIFGLTEIFISKKIRVINKAIPIMAGIFAPNESEQTEEDDNRPELYITGKAVFGNITIIRTE
jgi:uncharacterized protein YerC